MSQSIETTPSRESQIMLDTLKTAVTHTLEKKRRLGQYAVVWEDGRPIRIEGDAIGSRVHESETSAWINARPDSKA